MTAMICSVEEQNQGTDQVILNPVQWLPYTGGRKQILVSTVDAYQDFARLDTIE
jgi:hypothetical protein